MTRCDIAIVGAGPAGMTAAIYAARAGRSVVLFEAGLPGGQMGTTPHVDNYPGFASTMDGFELAQAMKAQVDRFGVVFENEGVVSADLRSDPKVLVTGSGTCEARAVVVATGVRTRELAVPGAEELKGHGVSYCATCDGGFFRGRPVAVVGGGDAAVSAAVYLANICAQVFVVCQRLTAVPAKRDALAGLGNVTVMEGFAAVSILQDADVVAGLAVRDAAGQESALDVAAVFGAAGRVPNTDLFVGQLDLDDDGYILADEDGRTSLPGVFAAGDVRAKRLRQIATAVGDGASAAEAASGYL